MSNAAQIQHYHATEQIQPDYVDQHQEEGFVADIGLPESQADAYHRSRRNQRNGDFNPDHSIDYLYNSGVSVGINTDTRTVSNVTLVEEYQKLHQYFGWGMDHFLKCNLNALEAAFLPEEKKEELKDHLVSSYKMK